MQVVRLLDGSAPIDMHSRAFQGALLFLCPEALRREPHAPVTYRYEPLTGSCHLIAAYPKKRRHGQGHRHFLQVRIGGPQGHRSGLDQDFKRVYLCMGLCISL